MKKAHSFLFAVASFLAVALSLSALLSAQQGPINPHQVALLRWYPVNLTASFPTSDSGWCCDRLECEPCPIYVQTLTYDGANIWGFGWEEEQRTPEPVAIKLRACDGAILSTNPIGTTPGIDYPGRAAYDGANIWVTYPGSGQLTKMRASDFAIIATYDFVADFEFVAFDGANIWLSDDWNFGIAKVRASDGTLLGEFSPFTLGPPAGLAFDGANIWVAGVGDGEVFKVRASDGVTLGIFNVGGNARSDPWGVVFDGANVWVSASEGTVTKLRASDGAALGVFLVPAGTGDLAFDGSNIWVSNTNSVTKLRASDGAYMGTFDIGGATPVFDGANVWVAGCGGFCKM